MSNKQPKYNKFDTSSVAPPADIVDVETVIDSEGQIESQVFSAPVSISVEPEPPVELTERQVKDARAAALLVEIADLERGIKSGNEAIVTLTAKNESLARAAAEKRSLYQHAIARTDAEVHLEWTESQNRDRAERAAIYHAAMESGLLTPDQAARAGISAAPCDIAIAERNLKARRTHYSQAQYGRTMSKMK